MSGCCTESVVKARKEHRCGECRCFIAAGVSYVRISGAQDGQGFAHKRCTGCHEAFTWLDAALRVGPLGLAPDEGIAFGDLHSELAEYASESRFRDPAPLRHMLGMAERRQESELLLLQRGAA